jgi:hypothetical protein
VQGHSVRENTLLSFQKAEKNHSEVIEFDVHVCAGELNKILFTTSRWSTAAAISSLRTNNYCTASTYMRHFNRNLLHRFINFQMTR